MEINRIDHIVLTVVDIDRTVKFYQTVLNMKKIKFANNRVALQFGNQKINLHQQGHEFLPNAKSATTGSADLCFISSTEIIDVILFLEQNHIDVIEGPVKRTGATGEITSVYFRDPDGNLIEVSNYGVDLSNHLQRA